MSAGRVGGRLLGVLLLSLVVLAVVWWALLSLPDAKPALERAEAKARRVSTRVPFLRNDGTGSQVGKALLAMPVVGVTRSSLADSWGDPRGGGVRAHHGTDIMAPGGTPVLAAAPGVVEKLWQSGAGGTTVYVRSPAKRWTYYYAHLAAYAPGLHEGQAVEAGDPIGFVGDTGDAGRGNFHLHFGLTRTSPEQHWYEGTDVDPFPYLAGRAPPR